MKTLRYVEVDDKGRVFHEAEVLWEDGPEPEELLAEISALARARKSTILPVQARPDLSKIEFVNGVLREKKRA